MYFVPDLCNGQSAFILRVAIPNLQDSKPHGLILVKRDLEIPGLPESYQNQ